MARRNPGGRGAHVDYVSRAESRFLRENVQAKEDGWVISNSPAYSHHDVTGVTVTAGALQLFAVPERFNTTAVVEARIAVASLYAGATIEAGLFVYFGNAFSLIPGTWATFQTNSIGLKTFNVSGASINPEKRLFIGVLASNGAPVLEGYQSGTVITGRLLGTRVLATTTFPSNVQLDATTINYTTDTPAVVYLSKQASNVL